MSAHVRIGPIPEKLTDDFITEYLRKICSFSKLERKLTFRSVVLSFENEVEAQAAYEKLQGLQLQWRKLSVALVDSENQEAIVSRTVLHRTRKSI